MNLSEGVGMKLGWIWLLQSYALLGSVFKSEVKLGYITYSKTRLLRCSTGKTGHPKEFLPVSGVKKLA